MSRSPQVVTSNTTRADYVGSEACLSCHEDLRAPFGASPMHRMTRDAQSAEVVAPFGAGATFRFGDESVRMFLAGGHRYMVIESPGPKFATYKVTKVIGGHHREDFAGRRVISNFEKLGSQAIGLGEVEDLPHARDIVLPVTWHYRHGEWRYKGYSVQVPERRQLVTNAPWDKTCIFCHNTVPYLATIYDDLGGYQQRVYQGSVPANLLPRTRQLEFRIRDLWQLAGALRQELALLNYRERDSASIEPQHLLGHALMATQGGFQEEHLVELGIGCESCHGGGREHADTPSIAPTFLPRHPAFEVTGVGGRVLTAAEQENHACARCHSVLFSGYEHTWEGGARKDSLPGGSTVNSGEARDFLLGACSSQMRCSTCHDPHRKDDKDRMARLATAAGNSVCTGCHAELVGAEALRGHAHHEPEGAGGSCIACHMPQKNIGLSYELQRYHRIGSPTAPERVERDRPLECALCHQDMSVSRLVGAMERWWGQSYDRSRLRALYGDDLDAATLTATIARGKSHERAVAARALGATGDRRHAAVIAAVFGDALPITRYMAREALGELFGHLPDVDMSLPRERLQAAIARWLDDDLRGRGAAAPPPARPPP